VPDTILSWSLRDKVKDIAQKQNQIQQTQEQQKPSWFDRVKGAVSNIVKSEVEVLKAAPSNLLYSIDQGVRQFDPKNLAAFPENLGNLWTSIARQLPGQQDWPETWKELTTGQKVLAGGQVVSLAALITWGINAGLSAPDAIANAYRLNKAFKAGEKLPTKEIQTIKGYTLAGKPYTEQRIVPTLKARPIVGEVSIPKVFTEAKYAIKPITHKVVETVKFKNTIEKQLYDLVEKVAEEFGKVPPTTAVMKPFIQTASHYIGAPIKGLIDPGYSQTVYNEINKILPVMLNEFIIRGEATLQIPTVTPEEKIVEGEMAKPLAKAPPGEEVAPKVLPEEILPTEVKPPIPPTPPPKELPQFGEEPIEDPIVRLNELIKIAKPLRGKLEKAYTVERTKRIAEVEKFIDETIDTVGGEEGYRMILSKLKGELIAPEAKPRFEPVKEKLTQEQLKTLYIRIWKHPYLDNWEKISTADGLTDLLMGVVPQPKKLVLLEEIYGSELIKNILSKRAWGIKVTDFLVEGANLPRALLATADMSAFLRQGIVEMVAHPGISAKVTAKTFQFAFSPKAFEQYFIDLKKDKLHSLMKRSGLAITDPRTGGMVEREEAFISRFLQKIPVVKIPVLFAERSYVGFLNKLRVDIFKVWADELLSKGFTPTKDPELFKSAAEVINTFTGRGSMGRLNRISPELNIIFFSPRLITARFNALNPIWYSKQPKEIRKKAIGDFAKFVAAGLTLLALIELSTGDEVSVETDPRSSDFGKIRIGNTRFDTWGGFQQWTRVFAQLITGERKNANTGEIVSLNKEEYPFTTRKEVLLRFVEGKLAPVPALMNELISGAKTFGGEDITLEYITGSKLVPMYIQDIADAYEDGGLGRAVGAGMPAFFGVGVQTWESKGGELGGIIRTRLRKRRESFSGW